MYQVVDMYFGKSGELQTVRLLAEHNDMQYPTNDISIDEVELMQCTGLKDKNGVEICEGDIVDFSSGGDYTGAIEFEKAMFIVKWKQPCYVREDLGRIIGIREYMEIISNVYESPELLEK